MGAFKKGQALFCILWLMLSLAGFTKFFRSGGIPLGIFKQGFFIWTIFAGLWFWCCHYFAGVTVIEKETDCHWKINVTPILVFLGIVALTTGLELLTSYIMEWTTGGWLWDYDRFAWNFQGRIALNPSIRFGIGGMFFLYCVQPLLEKANGALTEKTRSLLSGSLFVLICVDFFYHIFLKV